MAEEKGKTINYEETGELFAKIPLADLKETELFVAGDHWQEQKGWIGWTPESASEDAVRQFNMVQSMFNAKNVCGGMVSRIRGAALGKEPDWEIVPRGRKSDDPTPSEITEPVETEGDAEFKEVDKSITRWWDEKQVHSHLKRFIENRAAYGKAALRIFIPKGYIKQSSDGTRTFLEVSNLDDALDKIYIESPNYPLFVDETDEDFGTKFTVTKSVPKKEEPDVMRYEICYINQNKQTVLRTMQEAGLEGNVKSPELTLDLGGNLLVKVDGEYTDAIISPTVKAQQKAVNHAKTGESFALANINFPEVTFLNADIPTETITVNGKSVEQPKAMAQGFGRWRALFGLPEQDFQGGTKFSKPDIVYRDGADPEKFARVASNNTRDMHQEAGMLYIYLADSEYASGDARIEAMTDYLILLVDSKTLIDNTGHWLLTTVLRLAYNLMNKKDKIESFDVIFSSNLTIGRVSNEDKTIMLEEVAKGLRSQRNYMIKAEVTDDPASELRVIAADSPLKDAQPNPIEVAEATAKINQQHAPPGPLQP